MNEMDYFLLCLLGLGGVGIMCAIAEMILAFCEYWRNES